MCAHCAMTGDPDKHVDGTVLDRDLKPLFQGIADRIMDWIMQHPLLAHVVWVAGEGEPISIDEWTEWMDEIEDRTAGD